MTALVVRADSRTLPLADSTVDLVVTSPPYFGLRSYQDGGQHYAGQVGDEATPAEFVAALVAVTAECVRVLKPSGSIWVNLGDKYAGSNGQPGGATTSGLAKQRGGSNPQATAPRQYRPAPRTDVRAKSLIGLPWRYALACIDELGLILRAEVIWSKPNGLPESVTDRVRRSHEQWFHFTKEPRYFSAVDEVRLPQAHFHTRLPRVERGEASRNGQHNRMESNPLGSLPGSVWTIPTQPLTVPAHLGVDHFAAFPMEWPRRIIKGWSPTGGVVLDPFGGTGTTALVADTLGRTGISCDLSHDYSRLAKWRTTDPGQRASAMQVEKPKAELPGQEDLFGDAA